MKYILGIDIGTGSTKAVAVNTDSVAITVSQYHYPTDSPKPGYSEQNPELIWEAFQNCLKDIIEKMNAEPAAIGFSSAMHSLIPIDKNGAALSPMITWADSRSDKIAARLKDSSQGREVYEISGMPLHAMSPLFKIIWLRENQPDMFKQACKFISIKEYIWFKLFGEYIIDYSVACASGMFDVSSLKWSPELLILAGIKDSQLSKPVNTSYLAHTGCTLDGIAGSFSKTKFVVGASDGCLANLGSFALNNGTAAITIGTSGAVRRASAKPIFNYEAMSFSYYLDENTFICGGPVNNGGNVLQWLIRDFLNRTVDDQSFKYVFEQADRVDAGAEGLLFLPYLNGERAPIWDTKSSGAFIGIRSVHTQAHFCRAVLEGVCYALYEVLLVMESNSAAIDQINVSGGFVNSAMWTQLLADVTGRRLLLLQTEDASAIGAAFLAAKVLNLNNGEYPDPPEEQNEHWIEPDPVKHNLYKQNFLIFKSLYSSLKDSMHKIHHTNS